MTEGKKTATRRKNVWVGHRLAEGPDSIKETRVVLTMRVSVEKDGLTHVSGYGINEANFPTMLDVHNTFCCFNAPIRLDYNGCDEIAACLKELGFERPKGYFT